MILYDGELFGSLTITNEILLDVTVRKNLGHKTLFKGECNARALVLVIGVKDVLLKLKSSLVFLVFFFFLFGL